MNKKIKLSKNNMYNKFKLVQNRFEPKNTNNDIPKKKIFRKIGGKDLFSCQLHFIRA